MTLHTKHALFGKPAIVGILIASYHVDKETGGKTLKHGSFEPKKPMERV